MLLEKVIADEKDDFFKTIPESIIPSLLVELFRMIDSVNFLSDHTEGNRAIYFNNLSRIYNFGFKDIANWALYNHPGKHLRITASSKESKEWINNALKHIGQLNWVGQLYDYAKAGLGHFEQAGQFSFDFHYDVEYSAEYLDRISYGNAKNIISSFINDDVIKNLNTYSEIKRQVAVSGISLTGNCEIKYKSTQGIDEFYHRLGSFHFIQTANHDSFSGGDMFGGIPYERYLDAVRELMGLAFKHSDFCFALHNINPRADSYNTITQIRSVDSYMRRLPQCGIDDSTAKQILSCLTLNQENISTFTEQSHPPLPPFIQLNDHQVIMSRAGALNHPCNFLHYELKRRFPKDYFKAVNNREERFRNDLYNLCFGNENCIKVNHEVIIKWNGMHTDIDAAVFNKETGRLGIFQLKWQDSFGNTTKERNSRISNMYPKANEWIYKIHMWTKGNDSKSILNALRISGIPKDKEIISEVHIFILGRPHIHFSNEQTDQRAQWVSWYQLVESYGKQGNIHEDPILDIFERIKTIDASIGDRATQIPEIASQTINIGAYTIFSHGMEKKS